MGNKSSYSSYTSVKYIYHAIKFPPLVLLKFMKKSVFWTVPELPCNLVNRDQCAEAMNASKFQEENSVYSEIMDRILYNRTNDTSSVHFDSEQQVRKCRKNESYSTLWNRY